MILNYCIAAVLLGAHPPAEAMTVSARLDAGELQAGGLHDIILEVLVDPQWSASRAGVPAPLLQIDVPACAELQGEVLKSRKELTRNEFLRAPYERLLKQRESRIAFKLLRAPQPGEHFGLNVLAYVAPASGEDGYFLRRRLELPLQPAATARQGDPSNSKWGADRDLLQIGDVAADFNLPRADGSTVGLGTYLGHKNVVVSTYRAHW